MSLNKMFCYQCEQTAKGEGCTVFGVCGKSPDVSALIDLQVYVLTGLSKTALNARKLGFRKEEVDIFTCRILFQTLTNVNFDPDRFATSILKTVELRESLKDEVKAAGYVVDSDDLTNFIPNETVEKMIEQGLKVGLKQFPSLDEYTRSLQHIILFGIKGLAAYTEHAYNLGKIDDKIFSFIHESLVATRNNNLGKADLIDLVLKCGEMNLRAMELLDSGNTENYGHPTPTKVSLGTRKGKAILVSGHDLQVLEEILKQSQGKGINVYTHGEMLPAHGYPKLKKYSHFYGHYGTAWQNQQKEFKKFPGSIIITTNCLMKPLTNFKENIFTTNLVGWPDVIHIRDKNFTPVIRKSLEMPGFKEDEPGKEVMVGFARNTIIGEIDKIIEAIKNKDIRHIFLVGGCDGIKTGRNYYSELVEKTPQDTLVLTLACGKFRFFDKEIGKIGAFPRLLDIGQCNDAYSAIKIALALSKSLKTEVNKLPLSFVLSWYEQKAVAILLTLLYLGIRDIRLGPSFPAFINQRILSFLVEKYNIMPISLPEKDLSDILK